MNRTGAKIITTAGFFSILISLMLFILNFVWETDFPHFAAPVAFVGGIVLIIFSLAYHTEK